VNVGTTSKHVHVIEHEGFCKLLKVFLFTSAVRHLFDAHLHVLGTFSALIF